jgi:hypothetical protein
MQSTIQREVGQLPGVVSAVPRRVPMLLISRKLLYSQLQLSEMLDTSITDFHPTRVMRRNLTANAAIGLLVFSFFITGCETTSPTLPKVVDPGGDMVKYAPRQFGDDVKVYRTAIKENRITDATIVRDTMIQRVRLEIDGNYHQFEQKLFGDRAYFATAADWVELGLAGATTVVAGEGTKTILGAVLTATKGARLSLDKNFFREKTTETIMSAMQAERLKRLTLITQKMTSGTAAQYSWDEAWVDLLDYFYAGTIENALLSIAGQTGSEVSGAKIENREAEKDRADAFSLQKASKGAILSVRQLTRLRIKLKKEKKVGAAKSILDELGVKYAPDADVFKALQDQIDTVNQTDADKLKEMTDAFDKAVNP